MDVKDKWNYRESSVRRGFQERRNLNICVVTRVRAVKVTMTRAG